jgi:hypothetical protein
MAIVFGCGALVNDRRFGYIAVLGLAAAAITALFPSLAPAALTIMGFVAVGVSVYVSERWQ